MDCMETMNELLDDLKNNNYSEDVIKAAEDLAGMIEKEVPESENSEENPDYSKMSKDDMGKDLKKKGIISITVSHK